MAFRRFGLTGNIGSGKSEVATLLRQAGIDVINLDNIGREISHNDSTKEQIVAIFGDRAIKNGELDRKFIQAEIFASDKKRECLEKLLHPLIWQTFEIECERLKATARPMAICEAALIFEFGLDKNLDGVIVVTAHESLRRDRVRLRDEMAPEVFDRISKTQITEIEKLKRANHIIDNSGGIESLRPQVSSLINCWKSTGYLS